MLIIDVLIAVGPVLAYVSQLKLIKETKSLGSFSIYITAILLISNILRVYFWFTVGYAINLLFQSLCMIVFQMLLVKECVALSDHSIQSFWKWPTFDQYVRYLLGFTATMTIVTIVSESLGLTSYGNLVGLLSMSIEATLGWPQLISNFKSKSVAGLSFTMIGSWFLGDLAKTVYFVFENQPFQFVLCGSVQLIVDVLIIIQIVMYTDQVKNPVQFASVPPQDFDAVK